MVLLLLSLARDICYKSGPRIRSQEPALGLDSEEDELDISIDVDFNLSGVVLVELVAILVRWLILDFSQSLSNSWNHFSEQVEKGINVESLLDRLVIQICVQFALHSAQEVIMLVCVVLHRDLKLFSHKDFKELFHAHDYNLEVTECIGDFIKDDFIDRSFKNREEELKRIAFESVKHVFLVACKAHQLHFFFILIALREKVSSTVDYFRVNDSVLILAARSLHKLNKCIDELCAELSGVAVDIALDIDAQEIRAFGYEVYAFWVLSLGWSHLHAEMVLKWTEMAFAHQLQEPKHSFTLLDVRSLVVLSCFHLLVLVIVFILIFVLLFSV